MTSLHLDSYMPAGTHAAQITIDTRLLKNKITEVAKRALDLFKQIAYHSALIIAKSIAIPLELTAISVVATATVFSLLFSLPARYSVDEERVTPFHHLVSILDDLCEIFWITVNYGICPESERLQQADDQPNSPEFVLIKPEDFYEMQTPLLYAPGYLDTPETLRDSCRRLANETGRPVYIVKYRSLFQSIEEHAKDIARVQARIFCDTQRRDLILAGHSMGGVVTGHFIQQRCPADLDIKLWITIGSPLQGTKLAFGGLGDCAKDMRPHSSLLNHLNEKGLLDDVASFHIYSLTDHVVPSDSATRNHDAQYRCREPRGHLSMRSCSAVEQQIQQAIRKVA